MRHYEEKIVPPKPQSIQQVFKIGSCDICGKEAKSTEGIDDCLNWSKSHLYESNTVQIFNERKTNYPGSGSSDKDWFEICPDCFETKVKPFLESLGAKQYNTEYDW